MPISFRLAARLGPLLDALLHRVRLQQPLNVMTSTMLTSYVNDDLLSIIVPRIPYLDSVVFYMNTTSLRLTHSARVIPS